MKTKALLVGASVLENERFELIDKIKSDEYYTVAADAGILCFHSADKKPDFWVGDMDSLKDVRGIDIKEADLILPEVKDDTDMAVALNHVYDLGIREVEIYGGLGGKRESHSMANIQLLLSYRKKGCKIRMIGNDCEMFVLSNEGIEFTKDYTGFISIFSLTNKSKGVKIKGLKYVYEGDLTNDLPLGVSNRFQGIMSSVSVTEGDLLVILEK